jgi:hypothetical protein
VEGFRSIGTLGMMYLIKTTFVYIKCVALNEEQSLGSKFSSFLQLFAFSNKFLTAKYLDKKIFSFVVLTILSHFKLLNACVIFCQVGRMNE